MERQMTFRPVEVPPDRLIEVNAILAAAIEAMLRLGISEREQEMIVARIDALGYTLPSLAVRQAMETYSQR